MLCLLLAPTPALAESSRHRSSAHGSRVCCRGPCADARTHARTHTQAQRLLGEEESVSFVRSFTDTEKVRMLQMAVAVLYTPDKEHFGECEHDSRMAG